MEKSISYLNYQSNKADLQLKWLETKWVSNQQNVHEDNLVW